MPAALQALVETRQLRPDEITHQTRGIAEAVLRQSRALDARNFTAIAGDDLRRMFDQYDGLFLAGLCRQTLAGRPLGFRVSPRMTRAGGKTTRVIRRKDGSESFEIAVSSTLLFQTFHDVDRPITVTGIVCRDRLEALQRIFEHELVHLVEMLVWTQSNCAADRFQSAAFRLFGHTEHTHRLITPRERALARFGIRPGTRVRFQLDGTHYVGFVNRITRRATVLVEDPRGSQYSDGRRYAKFYVPLSQLEPI